MIFTLDVLRARKGDCLMLHYGDAADPRLVLIDGGPKQVYTPHLRPRIEAIRKKRKLAANKPLPVDLLLLSHLDNDHVYGLLEMTNELRTAVLAHQPPLVQVQQCWHNSFDNVIGNTPQELQAAFKSTSFGTASTSGELSADASIECQDPDCDEETIVSSLKVLASISEGAQLRKDAEFLKIPLNVEFDGELIIARKQGEAIELGDGLTVTVIGPMLPEIKALHKKHQAWLKELKKKGQTPEDVLAAYVDKSVPNLSSIVLLAEMDGKSMLLTGDARGDKVLKGLEFVGLVEKDDGKLHVDVLKVPHHGSANNLDNDFFDRITANHYVFSGNGEHGNPERLAIEMLANSRPDDDDYTIHLTYPVEEIDVERKKDWKTGQASDIKKKKAEIRADWSAEKHSLAGFFKKHPKIKAKLDIVDEAKPHFINLHGKFKL